MNNHPSQNCAQYRGDRIICSCLQVTEREVVTHIATLGLRSVPEVRCHTGAGDGCTACHRLLEKYIERHCQIEAKEAVAVSA